MKYFTIAVVLILAVFGLAGCASEVDSVSTSVGETAPFATADTRAEDEEVLAVVRQYTDAIKANDRKAAEEVLYAPRPSSKSGKDVDHSKLTASNRPPWFDYLKDSKFSAEETRIMERKPDKVSVRSVGSFYGSNDIYWIVDFEVILDKELDRWRISEIVPKPGGLRSLDELKKESAGSI